MVCLTDLFATCAAAVGKSLPENAAPDSFDLLPMLMGQGDAACDRDTLVIHKGTNVGHLYAIRQGDWKLILGQGSDGPSTGRTGPYMGYSAIGLSNSDFTPDGKIRPDAPQGQLYNLAQDPAETTNLYADHPEIVERLSSLLERLQNSGRSRP
jgi:arylsulfatase A-like enzyme